VKDKIEHAKQRIRALISRSPVPEDPLHAENTLKWLMKLEPNADTALQLAALAHDIDRTDEDTKVRRDAFDDYDSFKTAHAWHSAEILRRILEECQIEQSIIDEACRLVAYHEIGGDPRSDLLKDADGISYFEVNLPLYFQREGWQESKQRCIWGYKRLSERMKRICEQMAYEDETLNQLLKEAIQQAKREK
jgi:hypothetical protein